MVQDFVHPQHENSGLSSSYLPGSYVKEVLHPTKKKTLDRKGANRAYLEGPKPYRGRSALRLFQRDTQSNTPSGGLPPKSKKLKPNQKFLRGISWFLWVFGSKISGRTSWLEVRRPQAEVQSPPPATPRRIRSRGRIPTTGGPWASKPRPKPWLRKWARAADGRRGPVEPGQRCPFLVGCFAFFFFLGGVVLLELSFFCWVVLLEKIGWASPGAPGALIIYQGNPSILPRRTPMRVGLRAASWNELS